MDGHINSTSKESYLAVAKDPEARAGIEFDLMEHIADQIESLKGSFESQPAKCQKLFVKWLHVKIAGIAIATFLVGYGAINWQILLKLVGL